MANDRMYLRCETCGGQKLLAKSFGLGWITYNRFPRANEPLFIDPESMMEELNFNHVLDEWFKRHAHGRKDAPRFSIKYEVRDNA
jgi:hypothetical protein